MLADLKSAKLHTITCCLQYTSDGITTEYSMWHKDTLADVSQLMSVREYGLYVLSSEKSRLATETQNIIC